MNGLEKGSTGENLQPEACSMLFLQRKNHFIDHFHDVANLFRHAKRQDLADSFQNYLSPPADGRAILHLNPGLGANTAAVIRAFLHFEGDLDIDLEIDDEPVCEEDRKIYVEPIVDNRLVEADPDFNVIMHLAAHFPEYLHYQLLAKDVFELGQTPTGVLFDRAVGFEVSAQTVMETLEALMSASPVCADDFKAFYTTSQPASDKYEEQPSAEQPWEEPHEEITRWLSTHALKKEPLTRYQSYSEWVIDLPEQHKRINIVVFLTLLSSLFDIFGYYISCEPLVMLAAVAD